MKTQKREWGKDRSKLIALRLSEAEKKLLEEFAEDEGLTLSAWIRKNALAESVGIEGSMEKS